ncbi:MAG: YitT family protein [Clostridia bacterium]|nr:YitT family protein [Clostridia bacterium]
MPKRKKEKRPRAKRRPIFTLVDLFFYLVGGACYALSVVIFTAPNAIAPGGLTGVATILHHYFHALPIGTAILAMNVPLFIASWFKGGRAFTVRTLICTVWSSVAIDLFTALGVPAYIGDSDPLLVPIFGGLLMGLGLGLLFMRGACTGGSEIVARLFERRFPHLSVGRLILIVDAIVIAVGAFTFGVTAAMYAVILVFVSSTVLDALVYGGDAGKMAMIMSTKDDEIAEAIVNQLGRGCTKLESEGAYSGEKRRVLLCALRRPQLYTLRRLVVSIDPDAFIIITATDQVFGKGFKSTSEER